MRIAILYNTIEKKGISKKDLIAHTEILQTAKAVKKALEKKRHTVKIVEVHKGFFLKLKKEYDFVFNLAEDTKGDITTESDVPKQLDKFGIPYTGSNESAIKICADKVKTKKILQKNKILTPTSVLFSKISDLHKKRVNVEYPLIIKPQHTDGSIGIEVDSVVKNKEELNKKIREIINKLHQPALAEEYIEGREINIAVVGNSNALEILPPSEIIFNYKDGISKILTYESKWVENSVLYINSVGKCPAKLNYKLRKKIKDISKKIFKIMKLSDYARIDFRVKGDVPYVLEVNPNPCINPIGSGFARASKAAGYKYDEIIYKIFMYAAKRKNIKVK